MSILSPVAKCEVIVDGLKVECNTIGCNYEEYFPTYEDAEVAGEIHAGQ